MVQFERDLLNPGVMRRGALALTAQSIQIAERANKRDVGLERNGLLVKPDRPVAVPLRRPHGGQRGDGSGVAGVLRQCVLLRGFRAVQISAGECNRADLPVAPGDPWSLSGWQGRGSR